MNRVFVDMDGPTVDFDAARISLNVTGDELKHMPGAYLAMQPTPGALEAIRTLISWGYEVWMATKPPTGNANAYAEKAQWVLNNLPELKRRIIITHDKGLLGDDYDYLIDDRPHRANCEEFRGVLLRYSRDLGWPQILEYFRVHRRYDPVTQALVKPSNQ